MGLYRTCFFGKAGLLPGCKPIHAGSDMDARRLASDLLRDSPEVESLEVWRDADLVLRMNRNQMRLKQLSWTGDLLEGRSGVPPGKYRKTRLSTKMNQHRIRRIHKAFP